MHELEPHWGWRDYYTAEEDDKSPFHGREYSEFEFKNQVYNYVIHPQWDEFGSSTLYIKILFVDYEEQFTIMELIGEWNDCLYNDIMFLKRNVIDPMIDEGIEKYILVGENVMNFHFSDTEYYEEWLEEIPEGWVCLLNFRQHVIQEMLKGRMNRTLILDLNDDIPAWRSYRPGNLFKQVESILGM